MSVIWSVAGLRVQGGAAAAYAGPHAGGEALQVLAVLQGLRQQFLPVPAHADPPRHQAVPLRDLPAEVHATLASAAAHPDAHRGQTVQVRITLIQYTP